jgi:hypothetical protein
LEPLRQLYSGADLNAFADPNLGPIQVETEGSLSFARTVSFNGIVFCNVHLSAKPQRSIRESQLRALNELFVQHRGKILAVGGDFNLAPRDQDGYFLEDGRTSKWTGRGERAALGRLLSDHDLVDVLSFGPTGEFTFENASPVGRVRHRCDLLLCTRSALPRLTARYLHETRGGPSKFTDHSGIILSFEDGP